MGELRTKTHESVHAAVDAPSGQTDADNADIEISSPFSPPKGLVLW